MDYAKCKVTALMRNLRVDSDLPESELGCCAAEPPIILGADLIAKSGGIVPSFEGGTDRKVSAHHLQVLNRRLYFGVVNSCTVSKFRHIAFCFRQQVKKLWLQIFPRGLLG